MAIRFPSRGIQKTEEKTRGTASATTVMEEFCLINKDRSRIKVFKPFEDVLKPNPTINAMEIAYGCIYKRASKPVIKGSRVESIEDARKEYKKLLDEGWKKTKLFKSYF